MKAKLTLLMMVLLTWVTSVSAQHRSENEALQMAQRFFAETAAESRPTRSVSSEMRLSVVPKSLIDARAPLSRAKGKRTIAESEESLSSNDGSEDYLEAEENSLEDGSNERTAYYVVNDEANGRFVIVSADKRMIDFLGSSTKGVFSPDNVPDGLWDMLDGYTRELAYAEAHQLETLPAPVTRASRPTIDNLLKTTWKQSGHSKNNSKWPMANGKECLAGCVAVAMGQVMAVHGNPARGLESHSYNCNKDYKGTLSMDFEKTTFDWAKIANNDAAEVSKLLLACGISVEMAYGTGGSSAGSYNVAYALKQFFGYNRNVKIGHKDYSTPENWESTIINELQSGRPMIYSGRGSGGHAFVLSGCSSSGFYINWGWGGSCDGYYELSALAPKLGSTQHDYRSNQMMIYQISPRTVGENDNGDYFYADEVKVSSNKVNVGSKAQFALSNLTCFASDANQLKDAPAYFYGSVGFYVADANFKFISVMGAKEVKQLGMYTYYTNYSIDVNFDASWFKSGQEYYIIPFVRGNASDAYSPVATKNGATDYYLASVSGTTITLKAMGKATTTPTTPQPTTNPAKLSYVSQQCITSNPMKLTKNDNLKIAAVVKNAGGATNLKADLWIGTSEASPSHVAHSDAKYVDFKANGNTTVTMEMALSQLKPGKYKAQVAYYNEEGTKRVFDKVANMIDIEIVESSAATTPPKLTNLNLTIDNADPSKIKQTEVLKIKAVFTNAGGAYNVQTYLRIWDAQGNTYTTTDPVTTAFKANSDNTVNMTCSLDGFKPGRYSVNIYFLTEWDDNLWYRFTSQGKYFTVVSSFTGTPNVSFVSMASTNSATPLKLTKKDKIEVKGKFKNTGDPGEIPLRLRIFTDGISGVTYTQPFSANMSTNSTVEVTASYSLANMWPGKYKACIQYREIWDSYSWMYNKGYLVDFEVVDDGSAPTVPYINGCTVTSLNSDPKNLTQNDEVKVKAEFNNIGAAYNIKTRIAFRKNGSFFFAGNPVSSKFNANGTTAVTLSYPLKDLEPGDYQVAVEYLRDWLGITDWRYYGSQLVDITVKEGVVIPKQPDVKFVSLKVDNTDPQKLTVDDYLKLTTVFKNIGVESDIPVRVRIWDSNGKGVLSGSSTSKTFVTNENTSITLSQSLSSLAPGNYKAAIQYLDSWGDIEQSYWTWYEEVDFTIVKSTPPTNVPYISNLSLSVSNADPLNLTNKDVLNVRAVYTNGGASANIQTRLNIYDSSGAVVVRTNPITTTFQANGTTTVTMSYSLADLPADDYTVNILYQRSWEDNMWVYFISQEQYFSINAATAIHGVEAESTGTGVYTISGQKLDKPRKGLNIINGKKVVIK